jgi:Flp pilus assembly pilin Flp
LFYAEERKEGDTVLQLKRKFGPKTYSLTLTPNRRKETHMTTITRYTKGFVRYLRTNRAVSALEYAILVGIIAVAISAALRRLRPGIRDSGVTFSGNIKTAIGTVGTAVSTSTLNKGVN